MEFPLNRAGVENPETMVLAYIAVNSDSYCKLMNSAYSFSMGGTPAKYLETPEDLENLKCKI